MKTDKQVFVFSPSVSALPAVRDFMSGHPALCCVGSADHVPENAAGTRIAIGSRKEDLEHLKNADIAISYGTDGRIPEELLPVSAYAVFDAKKLGMLLRAIHDGSMPVKNTVVISCAGVGSRLGSGRPKALLEFGDETMIGHALSLLENEPDVRVVVGFQADVMMRAVVPLRKDVLFVFNHEYLQNGTGASVTRAKRFGGKYVLTVDGDIIIHPDDMQSILDAEHEFVGVTTPGTDNPVLTTLDENDLVNGFYRGKGVYEWTGVTKLLNSRAGETNGHTYTLVEPLLPMPYHFIRQKEVDTPHDYENALRWVQSGYRD